MGDQLRAVETGKADAAIAATTITKEREAVIDFTPHYFDSGLQILVHAEGNSHFLDVFDSIPWATLGAIFGTFVAIMFVMANILWFVERRTSEHFRKGYLKSIGEGLWAVALIVATGEHGDQQTARVIKSVIIFAAAVSVFASSTMHIARLWMVS